jgi:arylsulfatase
MKPTKDDSYQLPFKFTGVIDKLTFKLGRSQLADADQKAAAQAVAQTTD